MVMAEYIEREALIEKLETLLSDLRFIVKYEKQHGSVSDVEKSKAKFETMKGVISLVKSQPTADVQEVRHGKWQCCDNNNNTIYNDWYCSECGYYSDIRNKNRLGNYCSNCGAKMDKE